MKTIDLDPSEWHRTNITSVDADEPFFGEAALPILLTFLAAVPVNALATLVVYGRFPYWLQWLL